MGSTGRAAILALALGLTGGIAPAWADCTFDVLIHNAGTIAIEVRPPEFQVRSRAHLAVGLLAFVPPVWGPWRRAQNGGLWANRASIRLDPGASVRGQYRAAALCSDEREMLYWVECFGGVSNGGRLRAVAAHGGTWSSAGRLWRIQENGDWRCNS